MDDLYDYIAVIQGESSALALLHRESSHHSYEDQGIVIDCQQSVFQFENGVCIKYSCESDEVTSHEQICPECWISYQVIEEPAGISVRPKQKNFINHCQQAFWLKLKQQSQ
ncbi:MAG: hypothetical protein CENE_02341 [Candidatus Celerinatantimonas neptuna]|nr:MAG: hypothetical protein CENE_02341 [Candidatus Celerinatantimonas neptuna]